MDKTIREQILVLADKDYQKFSAKLLPNVDNIIGVRLPLLRKLAKEIAKGDWRRFMKTAEQDYHEEIILQGLVIGYVKADVEEICTYIAGFVPLISNWAVCDTFCNGLKFTKDNKERVWNFLQTYLISTEEYELRFGVVMLLEYYIEEEYIKRVLMLLDNVKHQGYYVKMAVAWAVSLCYVKLPEPTMAYLKQNTLDNFTYNKVLQKIIESYRVDRETKKLIRSMKRK